MSKRMDSETFVNDVLGVRIGGEKIMSNREIFETVGEMEKGDTFATDFRDELVLESAELPNGTWEYQINCTSSRGAEYRILLYKSQRHIYAVNEDGDLGAKKGTIAWVKPA